jgi:hypothetical protein
MLRKPAQLQKMVDRLASGLLSVPEVTAWVLDRLAVSPNRAELWAGAPAALREPVMAYLVRVGLDGLPPVFYFGPSDPVWYAQQAARRREVAAELLAAANRSDASDARDG